MPKALARAGIKPEQIYVWQVHEAFSAQALGALLRNQILTVVVGLVVILLAGTFALIVGSDVGRYFPGESLLGLQGSPEGKGIVLGQTTGGLVFAGYCAALAIAGMVLTRVREIT